MMADATPERLAKKIAQKIAKEPCGAYSNEVYLGALAAIIETTERAAKLADRLPHVTNSPKSGVTVWGPDSVATALRNQEHLKND